jgi:hypothetical protein
MGTLPDLTSCFAPSFLLYTRNGRQSTHYAIIDFNGDALSILSYFYDHSIIIVISFIW